MVAKPAENQWVVGCDMVFGNAKGLFRELTKADNSKKT
jgi:hypothetical protein